MSGQPGAGKTMTITSILNQLNAGGFKDFASNEEFSSKLSSSDFKTKVQGHCFNAMNFKSSLDIFSELYNAFTGKKLLDRVNLSNHTQVVEKLKDHLQNKSQQIQ